MKLAFIHILGSMRVGHVFTETTVIIAGIENV